MHPSRLLLLLACAALLAACSLPAGQSTDIRRFTVLYTNDEHGWMEGMAADQGAANLMTLWEEREAYRADGDFLLLSGGDNWTGPAISTWTEGESMVEVMNAMGYAASAVGNHEFDFGLDALRQRSSEADYPYLSANTVWRDSGRVATELGLLPFTIERVNSVRVGIIGLTTRDTPTSTNPDNVAALRFDAYETALRRTVPQVRARDTDLLFVISHVCIGELDPLMRRVADLQIALFGAGHCNELTARGIGEAVLLGGGFHFTAYARAEFAVDLNRGSLVDVSFATRQNSAAPANPALATLIDGWSQKTAAELERVIAYSDREVRRADGVLNQAIARSWLWQDPTADVAITNAGGIRIDLPAGDISLDTLVAMMPFDNTIVALDLSGAALAEVLQNGSRPVVAGLRREQDRWLLRASGEPLDPQRQYRVLVNSFMYAGGDGYESLAAEDPEGFNTGIHYRQPFQDWLEGLNTSADNPLRLRH